MKTKNIEWTEDNKVIAELLLHKLAYVFIPSMSLYWPNSDHIRKATEQLNKLGYNQEWDLDG